MRGNRFFGKGLRALVAIGAAAAVAQGCGGGGEGGNGNGNGNEQPGEVQLKGAIQKGPFVIGSNVVVSVLDAAGSPTGTNYNTTTRNDLGEFELKVSKLGLAEISTTGFYFNEMTGELSKSQITLRALAELSKPGEQSVYVNALTQVSHQRVKKLLASGKSFSEAVQQAESEVRTALGLPQRSTLKGGTDMNLLGGDDDNNAYLFALSCVLGQAALLEAPSSPDARLQELVGALALDLESDGALSDSRKQTLALARLSLNPMSCAKNMRKRLLATGSSAEVPNILKAVDFDGDGTVDLDDTDADGDGMPAAQDKAVAVAANGFQNFVADSGGQVWRWNLYYAGSVGTPRVAASFGSAKAIKSLTLAGAKAAALLADGSVWWIPAEGEAQQETGVSNVVQLYGRPECTSMAEFLAVKTDGTVWKLPEFGDIAQVSGLSDVALVAGSGSTLAVVKKDGSLWNVRAGTFLPVSGVSGVTALVGGGSGCTGLIALTSDGAAYTWNVDATTDTAAQKIAEGVVSASSDHQSNKMTLVKADGTVWRWTQGTTLTQVSGLSNVAAIASRGSVALLKDGTVTEMDVNANSTNPTYERPYLPR